MIRPGDRLENPVTGEVLIFHHTAAETSGESVLVETIVRPDGFVAAAHVHPYQTERFEMLEGQLGLRVGGEKLVARPGDFAVVEPGTPHRFWNAGEGEARFLMGSAHQVTEARSLLANGRRALYSLLAEDEPHA